MFYTKLVEMSPVTESTVNINDSIDEKALLEAFELIDPDFDGAMESMVNIEMQLNALCEGLLMGDCALESSVLESAMSLEDANGVMEATMCDFKNKTANIANTLKRTIITFMDQVELLINQLTDRNKKFYEAHRQEIMSGQTVVLSTKPITINTFNDGMQLGNKMLIDLKEATADKYAPAALDKVQNMYAVKGSSFGEKVKEAFKLNQPATNHGMTGKFAQEISITKMKNLEDIKRSKSLLLTLCDNMEKITRSVEAENQLKNIQAIKSACNHGMTIVNAQKQAVQEYSNVAMQVMKKMVSGGNTKPESQDNGKQKALAAPEAK